MSSNPPLPPRPEVVDELPDDENFIADEYQPFVQFLAYVRSSRITVAGEVQITLAVPYEWKYNAMPLTDLRGVVFVVDVARPIPPGEKPNADSEGDSGETAGLVSGPTLSLVRDSDPFAGDSD